MGQTRAEIITLMGDEHLRLMLEPAKGAGMDDPVAVALKARAERAVFLGREASARAIWMRGDTRGHSGRPPCRGVLRPIYCNSRRCETAQTHHFPEATQMNLPPHVTSRAFERLSEIGASAQGQALRVAVEGGGCSGFQYEIKLDTPADDDLVLEGQGQK